MKKLWIIGVVFLFLGVSGCHRSGEFCPPVDKEGISFNDTGWNTSHTIAKYFSFAIRNDHWNFDSLEYRQLQGMEVKVCGWIYNDPQGVKPGNFYLTDNPLYSTSTSFGAHVRVLHISYNGQFPEDFDITKKCYVVGKLSFWAIWLQSEDQPSLACNLVTPEVIASTVYFEE